MKYIFILTLILLTACESEYGQEKTQTMLVKNCKTDISDVRADFTLKCIEKANPKSDEEPEDWILKCLNMADDIYCPIEQATITYVCVDRNAGRCSSIQWKEKNRVYNR